MLPCDPIVEALVCSMVSVRRDGLDRLGITAELVGDHDTGIAIGGNQTSKETLCGFGVAAGLNESRAPPETRTLT